MPAHTDIPPPRTLRHNPVMDSASFNHLDVVRAVRDARFTAGHFCPRCDSRDVVRWGRFSGRQRYRCKSCRRTFSDLTSTAFAYMKAIGKWPHYLVLMRQGRTLRVAAAQLDVHVSTSFRWRHAILSVANTVDAAALSGTVELKELLFAHSNKGTRDMHTPRQRGARSDGWRWNQVPRDRVLLGFSRGGVAHSSTVGGDVAVIGAVQAWVTRLAGRCTVLGYSGRAGPIGSCIRTAGHDYQMLRVAPESDTLTSRHTLNVDAYARRLTDWLKRFRGVASRYRDNYLYWHRRIEYDSDLLWARAFIVASTHVAQFGDSHGPPSHDADPPL